MMKKKSYLVQSSRNPLDDTRPAVLMTHINGPDFSHANLYIQRRKIKCTKKKKNKEPRRQIHEKFWGKNYVSCILVPIGNVSTPLDLQEN